VNSTAIQVRGLGKRYTLGTIGYGSLQSDLRAWWARVQGKEDPNAQIGQQGRFEKHGAFWALKDLDFEIEQGARVGIIGKNGAGKSTLLKILSRVTAPTEGVVKIRGRLSSLLEVGTGFHPELTGRENVFLNGSILGMKRREIQAKFDDIVSFAGVSQFIDTPVKRYSSGMYVRLAFSVAAHLNSEILIVDEVLAVGDAEFQEKCINKMKDISSSEGRTILFVSHNLASLKRLCNKGILLSSGQLKRRGDIDEVITDYLGSSARPADSSALSWTNPDPSDSVVNVLRVRFLETGAQPGEKILYNSRRYQIEIRLQILQDEDNLALFLTFYNEVGDIVFVGDIQHSPEVARKARKKGEYTLYVDIPQDLFLSRNYQVEVSCCIHMNRWVLSPGPLQRIPFTYYNDNLRFDLEYSDVSHIMSGGLQPGDIAPHLTWRI
jgi:lipopolysaccharide transport system ATP-binding protein